MNISSPVLHAIRKYVAGESKPEDDRLVHEWFHSFDFSKAEITTAEQEMRQQVEKRMWSKINQAIDAQTDRTAARKIVGRRFRWVAAAACIAILCTGAWFLFVKQPAVDPKGLAYREQATVLPGTNKAVLTLADGRQIMLDNTAGKTITDQNGIKISNQAASGQLAYHSPAHSDSLSTVYYNVLTTPRGGQYEVLLADGSHVWLNAASSLKYPNVFAGKERVVEVTGEAYFEIAGNPAKPFRIKVNDHTAVEVLGTHFNINAYRDEEAIKTTLIEGSVRVAGAKGAALLKPGQQCVSAAAGSVDSGLKITQVDTDAVIAWKNGVFNMHHQGVAEVMRQLTRWYDIEVEYKGKVPAITFWGEMSRYENLSSILDFMRESGINFKIENGGKKITVIP